MMTDLENWAIKKVLLDLEEAEIKKTMLQYWPSDSKSSITSMLIHLQSQQKSRIVHWLSLK